MPLTGGPKRILGLIKLAVNATEMSRSRSQKLPPAACFANGGCLLWSGTLTGAGGSPTLFVGGNFVAFVGFLLASPSPLSLAVFLGDVKTSLYFTDYYSNFPARLPIFLHSNLQACK